MPQIAQTDPSAWGLLPGSSDVWVQRFYFSVDNKRPEDYDKLPPVCLAKEHNFKENCHTLIESGGPCSQGRWNGKLQVHVRMGIWMDQ